ncbi:uroporphyrinogen decarboxylase family protein [Planctomycetota bacterium]
MNSKERAKIAFSRGLPDRPALGFFAIDSDTAGKVLGRETYWRAKAKSQIAFWEGRRDEVVQSWIEDGIELYKKLDIIDIIPVCCDAAGMCPPKDYEPDPPKKIDDSTWVDKAGCVYKYSPVTKDITMVEDPGQWSRQYKLEDELWDGKVERPDESIFEVVDAFIDAFGKDKFILGPAGDENVWLLLGGMERGMMEIASRPEEVKEIYMSRVKQAEAVDEYYIRPGQDGILWGEDIAFQGGPMINPRTYRELFLHGFTQRISHVKEFGQTLVKHSCGNNWDVLDMFVEAGIDCYQSIQASAGMDIAEVQKKYKDDFAVWGGVPVENLIGGTAEDVRGDVDKVMKNVAGNGGFVLGTSHSVAVGSNYDNFMALLDQFNELV